jgi:regulation of enolase protein 1 (concanavalin A-like superfamily)
MQWFNEPPQWQAQGESPGELAMLTVKTGPKTDFWRTTHYGFIRDDGHAYYDMLEGNFTLDVRFIGQYRDLYDQAGLMLRVDAENWIKCGIEYVDGVQQASTVATRVYSDWSVTPLRQSPPTFWLRVKREGDAVEVFYSLDGQTYTLMRLAYLLPGKPVQAGLMCCSPQGDGFEVRFEGFSISRA